MNDKKICLFVCCCLNVLTNQRQLLPTASGDVFTVAPPRAPYFLETAPTQPSHWVQLLWHNVWLARLNIETRFVPFSIEFLRNEMFETFLLLIKISSSLLYLNFLFTCCFWKISSNSDVYWVAISLRVKMPNKPPPAASQLTMAD